jgi:hypothetical protein
MKSPFLSIALGGAIALAVASVGVATGHLGSPKHHAKLPDGCETQTTTFAGETTTCLTCNIDGHSIRSCK